IAPIHQAKFLAGAKFDFRVELNDWTGDASAVRITINGKGPEAVFGKKLELTSTAKSREFTVRDVSFPKAGPVSVSVQAGSLKRTVQYEV
ncbi:hypothetical protein MXD81_21450, partial [Microbacteriaceae bacterium K1510]|nr:hypothetical protein [Microbacteriaceae bacterium K1510]